MAYLVSSLQKFGLKKQIQTTMCDWISYVQMIVKIYPHHVKVVFTGVYLISQLSKKFKNFPRKATAW